MIKITLFCGGRGSASIIREILRIQDVELNLLVNAYDNGDSTGALRRYIPGYLGPSDFRKNLSYLLELYSPEQYVLSKLIDYRMPANFDKAGVEGFIAYLDGSEDAGGIPIELKNLLQSIGPELKKYLYAYLINFFDYYLKNKNVPFNFNNCSLGNLLFAGAFFKNANNFEQATQELMTVFRSKVNANLFNVSSGENRFLMALKENGEFIDDEAKIVKKQSSAKYSDIYLIPQEFTKEELNNIYRLGFDEKKAFLDAKNVEVNLSEEARYAIENCDVIIFGPGTQFSSLFPSYKTKGIGNIISASKAEVKFFVININKDCDIESYRAEDLIDTALDYLGDKANKGLITHALFNKESNSRAEGVRLRDGISLYGYKYKNIEFVTGDYEHPSYKGTHSGTKTVNAVLNLYESKKKVNTGELDIYVDLHERSLAVRSMIEEVLELDWRNYVTAVKLYINNVELPQLELPHYFEIHADKKQGYFSEIEVFKDWLLNKNSNYLVTITGDGEYRMRDIVHSINILNNTTFGAVYGSRNQSRKQLISSLTAAYGESRFFFHLSRLGAILVAVLFALRVQVLFSDPLTGFRVYNRRVIKNSLKNFSAEVNLRTPITLARYLIRHKIEIAEIPVNYRTFKGFTNVKRRMLRGLANLLAGIFL